MPCCLGGTDQRQICFAGTSEDRLDGVAECVALQGVVPASTPPTHQRHAFHKGEHVAASTTCLRDVAEVC